MTHTLTSALLWLEKDFAVFPLVPRGKIPLGSLAPHGLKDATHDHAVVREWWRRSPASNIGIATGGGHFVLDLDDADAARWFSNECDRHGGASKTLTVRTARGFHVFFASNAQVPNSASRLSHGVDVRGANGYVVAAPSVHPTGRAYTIVRDLPIAEAPPWLVDLAMPEPVPPPTPPYRRAIKYDGPSARFVVAKIEGLAQALSNCPKGSRNSLCNWAGFSMRQLVASGQADGERVAYTLARAATGAGLSFPEADRAIRSGMGWRHG